MSIHYHLLLPDPEKARGSDASLSFTAISAEGFAEQLQTALRATALFERWRAMQPDPDDVDAALGIVDPAANVTGSQEDLSIRLVVETRLSGEILRQRMRWLAGSAWQLRDVR